MVTLHSVVEIRDSTSANSPIQSSLAKNLVLPIFFKIIEKFADAILVHDIAFRQQLTKYYRVPGQKIVVIPHGVSSINSPEIELEVSSEFSRLNGKHIVLFFGFLSPRKGIEYLLQSFKEVSRKVPNSLLVVAGDAPHYYRQYKKELEKLTRTLSLQEKVFFAGFIPESVANRLFSISEIVVFPYTHSPSASGPLSKALQYNKAIVATNTEYFENILENEKTALLIPPKDSEHLADAIIRLLEDNNLRKFISKNTQVKAAQNAWAEIGRKTIALYSSLLSNSSKPPLWIS